MRKLWRGVVCQNTAGAAQPLLRIPPLQLEGFSPLSDPAHGEGCVTAVHKAYDAGKDRSTIPQSKGYGSACAKPPFAFGKLTLLAEKLVGVF